MNLEANIFPLLAVVWVAVLWVSVVIARIEGHILRIAKAQERIADMMEGKEP